MEIALVDKYRGTRYKLFAWRYGLEVYQKVLIALSLACFTGLLAQMKFFLPWTPVPVTGQTFAVLLSGVLGGKRYGAASQVMYVGIGAAGIPWFAGFSSGISYLTGATGGYLLGFILAAWFIGYLTETRVRSRSYLSLVAIMLFANFVLIYAPGLAWLYVWSIGIGIGIGGVSAFGIPELLMMGVLPFLAGDVTKALAAAVVAGGITPKTAYNGEVDAEKAKRWMLP
jgi:biotin transport system substrate-specific component